MQQLVLIRHSTPELDPNADASEWHLSDEGRRLCQPLAQRLTGYGLGIVVTSVEPKAVETGQAIAKALRLPFEHTNGLHEHDRSGVGWLQDEEFRRSVGDLFNCPDALVFGEETANQAYGRFAGAVDKVLLRHSDKNVAIVTHGTVMSLFAERKCGLDPVTFWSGLKTPSFVVLSLPGLDLTELVTEFG